jgi:hypothetical protein
MFLFLLVSQPQVQETTPILVKQRQLQLQKQINAAWQTMPVAARNKTVQALEEETELPLPEDNPRVNLLGNSGREINLLGNSGREISLLGNSGREISLLGNSGREISLLGNSGREVNLLGSRGREVNLLGNSGRRKMRTLHNNSIFLQRKKILLFYRPCILME